MPTLPQPDTQGPPEIKILTRVASIPMVYSSLETINDALISNNYTRGTYTTAMGLSSSAYKYTESLQIKLAPFILRADDYANKAVDAVEQRYPYPFKAKPEEVATYVRSRRQSASESVNKAIDEKVRTPAFSVAQGIDQRFAPIVDYLEVAIHRLNTDIAPSNASESKYQYQRALAISKDLTVHIYDYSNDQLKHIGAQLQRATETAHSITNLATSSISKGKNRIHTLSDNMLSELQKLQASTTSYATSLQNSASTKLQHNIPPQVQQSYSDLASNLSSVITELKGTVLEKDLPIQEKVTKVGKQVKESITPLLDTLRKGVEGVLASAKTTAAEAQNEVNGNAH